MRREGDWLLVIGDWLLVMGDWLLAIGDGAIYWFVSER